MISTRRRVLGPLLLTALLVTACGNDDATTAEGTSAAGDSVAVVSLAADTIVTQASSADGVPETVAPETGVPETGVPETVAPETVAPDVTLVPVDSVAGGDTEVTVGAPDELRRGAPLVLRAGGLGKNDFGAPADEVLADVAAVLGAPTSDSGWGEQQAPCDQMGEKARTVVFGWLVLSFSDGPDPYGPAGDEHFASFAIFDPADGSPDPELPASDGGPLLGATLADLQRRYPGATASTNEIQGAVFQLPDGLGGELSHATETGRVVGVRAGNVCID